MNEKIIVILNSFRKIGNLKIQFYTGRYRMQVYYRLSLQ